jgi:hypothetical protein
MLQDGHKLEIDLTQWEQINNKLDTLQESINSIVAVFEQLGSMFGGNSAPANINLLGQGQWPGLP